MSDMSSVSNDDAVVHDGAAVRRYDDLSPATDYDYDGHSFTTLPALGELLCSFATVNDVHFGEPAAGIIEGLDDMTIFQSAVGEDPYPEVMNRGAIDEIAAMEPAAVLAKGDLTCAGTQEEYDTFLDFYEGAFGDAMFHVRGNHDAYKGQSHGDTGPFTVELPGVTLAVLDTTIPTKTTGQVTAEQIQWLGDTAASADGPVLVFGHHQNWNPDSENRSEDYFGINPDDSEALVGAIAAHKNIRGYFAGHTHRNRVRHCSLTPGIPYVEVGCVKDFPGSWAEYRVFDGGILQVHRRISSPEALAWSEQCRGMYAPYIDYPAYAMGELHDRCFVIAT